MKEIITRGDKISLFFFKYLFPKFYEELLWLNREYRKAQDAKRVKQNELQLSTLTDKLSDWDITKPTEK